MKNVALIIAVLLFVFSYEGLLLLYPEAKTNYNAFVNYYYAKERVNEILFALLFYSVYRIGKAHFFKAVAMFGFTVAFSSMLDKVFFGNFQYLITDVIIVMMAFFLSYKVYKNGTNPSNPRCNTNSNTGAASRNKRLNHKNSDTITGSSIN